MAADQWSPLSLGIRIRLDARADFDPDKSLPLLCAVAGHFAQRFAVRETDLFAAIVGYCGAQRGGSLGRCDLVLQDVNGDKHVFEFETFFNRHEALTLGSWARSHGARVLVQTS